MDDRTERQLAQNEDLFRQINEKIDVAASAYGTDAHLYEFFCECSDLNCVQRVSLTLQEYAFARADPSRFVVTKDHALDEIEHVVGEARDHVFVEKDGAAGRAAVELDTQPLGFERDRVPRLCHDSGMERTRISLGRLSDDRMPEICEALEIAVDCDG